MLFDLENEYYLQVDIITILYRLYHLKVYCILVLIFLKLWIIQIAVYDFDEGDDHDLIGQFETTLAEFSAGNKVLNLRSVKYYIHSLIFTDQMF